MPIYEFQCLACGHEFEELVRSANDAEGLVCPQCNRPEVKKMISSFATQFTSAGGFSSLGSSSKTCNPGSA